MPYMPSGIDVTFNFESSHIGQRRGALVVKRGFIMGRRREEAPPPLPPPPTL